MKQISKSTLGGMKWSEVGQLLPIELTVDGEVVAVIVRRAEEFIDISEFHPLMKMKIQSLVELAQMGG